MLTPPVTRRLVETCMYVPGEDTAVRTKHMSTLCNRHTAIQSTTKLHLDGEGQLFSVPGVARGRPHPYAARELVSLRRRKNRKAMAGTDIAYQKKSEGGRGSPSRRQVHVGS